jgi:hypothetical protein
MFLRSIPLALAIMGGLTTVPVLAQTPPSQSINTNPQTQSTKPKATPTTPAKPESTVKYLDYTSTVCGQKVFSISNTFVSSGNDPRADLSYSKSFQPITKSTLTQLAYGMMVASSEVKISDDTRNHLVSSLVRLYTDVSDPAAVQFSNVLIEEIKKIKVKPSKCTNPDYGMAYIKSTFEQANIYRTWLQEYRMFQLRKKLYPKEYKY